MKTLNELAIELYQAKRSEDEAKKKRIEIEELIAAQVETKDRGQATVDAGEGMKITVKRDLSYDADCALISAILGPDAPVKTVPAKLEFDATAYERLRTNAPDLYDSITKYVTTKPKKPSVTIKLA